MSFSKIVVFLILFFSTVSCFSKKQPVQENPDEVKKTIPSTISASNQFRMLWDDAQIEMGNTPVEQFVPSPAFVDKYNLQYVKGTYFFSGFLHTDVNFVSESIRQLGGTSTKYSEKLYSFRMPVGQLFSLVTLKGITRIELAVKGIHRIK